MLRQLDSHWKEHIARSTTCGRASTCAATRSAIRSRSTSAKRSRCSARCSSASSTTRLPSCRESRSGDPRTSSAVEPPPPDPRKLQFQHAEAPSLVAPRPCRPLPGSERRRHSAAAARASARRADCPVRARATEGGAQRALSLRVREEIQAVPRAAQLTRSGRYAHGSGARPRRDSFATPRAVARSVSAAEARTWKALGVSGRQEGPR